MYSDMSIRTIASWLSNMNSASARASSVLPTPVGPRNRNVPIGRSGSWSPARERRSALATALDRLVLADHALVQPLLHVHELLDLALHQARDRNARPLGDDLGDVLGVDVVLEELRRCRAARVGHRLGLGRRRSCFSSSGIVPYWSSAARPRSASRWARSSSIFACSIRS